MLFDRQRVLLELLDALNEPVGSTDFQKLLFLYTREGEPTPSYDFVPYRFGCFSFTSYADKRRLVEQELIEDGETWKLTDKGRRIARSGEKSPLPMARFAKQYKNLRGNALVADVYQRYPYFATRSEIVEKVFPKKEDRARVEAARPAKQTPGLVTLGYESKTLEAYLNQLLQDGVTLLCAAATMSATTVATASPVSANQRTRDCFSVGRIILVPASSISPLPRGRR